MLIFEKQFHKFLFVGILVNIINFLTYFILVYDLKIDYWISSSTSFFVGAFVGFILNKFFTFKFEGKFLRKFFEYISSQFFTFLINLCLIIIIYNFVIKNKIIAQLITLTICAIVNYKLLKLFVFRR